MTPVDDDLVWPEVAVARTRLADLLLTTLGHRPDLWDLPTPCDGWTVGTVVAHLLAMASVPPPRAMGVYLRHGADLDRANADLAARTAAGRTPEELVGQLRTHAAERRRPPGLRPVGVLAEVVVHSADVDWSRGAASVPEVAGPAAALVLALAGRRVGLDRLEGTGVGRLRATWAE